MSSRSTVDVSLNDGPVILVKVVDELLSGDDDITLTLVLVLQELSLSTSLLSELGTGRTDWIPYSGKFWEGVNFRINGRKAFRINFRILIFVRAACVDNTTPPSLERTAPETGTGRQIA